MGAADGEAFVARLLAIVPELGAAYEEHLANHDALLPHVFLGDVARFAASQAGNVGSREMLERLLGFLEKELRSENAEIAELVAVSFVENLIDEDVSLQELLPLMGEALREELERFRGP